MTIGNDTLSLMKDYLAEKEKARKADGTEKSAIDKKVESLISKLIDSEKNSDSERETFGLKSLELMSEDEYKSFERATNDMSESEKRRYAQSIHYFSMNYVNATTQNQSSALSLLSVQDNDPSSMLGSSFMLKVSEFSLKEGKDMLSKMGNSQNSQILGFMNRFKNALLSEEKIDTKG